MLFVIISFIADSLGTSLRKPFKGKSVFLFSAIIDAVACLVFLFYSKFQLVFDKNVILYGMISALLMTSTGFFLTKALQIGSLSLSSLIMSLSLLIPTFYGIFFLHNSPSIYFYFGLVVLVVAIVFLNVNFKKDKEEKTFTITWLIFILLACLGNGVSSASISQFTDTLKKSIESGLILESKGSCYQSSILVLVFGVSSIISFLVALFKEGKTIKPELKSATIWGAICGLAVGIVNLFVILAQMQLPASIVFTVISGGSMSLTFITALFIFKEKYTATQYIGFALGIVSLVLLNL